MHLGLILLIALAATNRPLESLVNVDKRNAAALKSYIFIPKPQTVLSKPPASERAEVDAESKQKVVEQNVILEKIPLTEVIETINQAEPIVQSASKSSLINKAPIKESPLKDEPKEVSVLRTSTDRSETTIVTDIDAKYRSLISKHLANYHSNYSQQQAQEYRALQKSPIIDSTSSTNTNDIVLEAPIVSVDCNNTGSQVVAVISGLLNGTVKCESNNSFQSYIDQRLNAIAKKDINPPKITNKVTLKPVDYDVEDNSDVVN